MAIANFDIIIAGAYCEYYCRCHWMRIANNILNEYLMQKLIKTKDCANIILFNAKLDLAIQSSKVDNILYLFEHL